MTNSLRESILEKDQMYAEYIREISLQFVERLSFAVSTTLFEGNEINIIVEDINLIPQNLNYVALVLHTTRGSDKPSSKDEVIVGNTITFAIPLDILEKGTTDDITEYLEALRDDPDAKGKPIPADINEVEYAQRIIDKVKSREAEEKKLLKESGNDSDGELDEIQKALMKFVKVTESRH